MKQLIIGTAGHVDHGKTALTQRLTGIDTDRLAEEKQRGISIALGFAPLPLGEDLQAGIVDVPGHERFIKTMLAGVAGIDMVLFVVAADEGVMPQTVEHLDILTLLGVQRGIVVLTKADLVDEDWLAMVRADLQPLLAASTLVNAPVLAVSAKTGQGIEQLRAEIAKIAAELPPRQAVGALRLPIDRSFTVSGFGTVVTGTLWSGTLHTGDFIELYPKQISARIRSLQVHGQTCAQVEAGSRTAVNLAGVELADAVRGGWLAEPNLLVPANRLDIELRLLANVGELKHGSRVRIYHGTREFLGRIHFFDREILKSGEQAFAQLQLEEDCTALRGDAVILRSYSPMHTLGGGKILEQRAVRHKRYKNDLLAELAMKSQGDPQDLLYSVLLSPKMPLLTAAALGTAAKLEKADLECALAQLQAAGRVIELDGSFAAVATLQELWRQGQGYLQEFHHALPLRLGMSKEEFKSRLLPDIKQKPFAAVLLYWQQQNLLRLEAGCLALADFAPQVPQAVADWAQRVQQELAKSPYNPPSFSDLAAELPEPLRKEATLWLWNSGSVIKLNDEISMTSQAVEQAIALVQAHLQTHGTLSLGEMRDLLQTSRKYALPLLEYLDRERVTRRRGDERVRF